VSLVKPADYRRSRAKFPIGLVACTVVRNIIIIIMLISCNDQHLTTRETVDVSVTPQCQQRDAAVTVYATSPGA
jgi:hypothetical protein